MPDTIKFLDPVQGLIDYVNDIKPYHTKIIESLVEYVNTEFVNITILEGFSFNIELIFSYDINVAGCAGGYSALPFDDPENFPILSPDVSKKITDVQTPPVFTSNSFIVLGDKTQGLDPSSNLTFKIESFIEDTIIDVTKSSGSPVMGGEFYLLGDRSSRFTTGYIFSVSGSFFNDTSYIVTADATYDNVPNTTKIVVDNQRVISDDVSGFIKILDSTDGSPSIVNNNGSFSVISSVFTPGTTTISPYTTTVISGITLVPPTGLDLNQRYVSSVLVGNLVYKKIFTYSNILKYYNASPTALSHTPDEGNLFLPIVNLSSASPSYFEVEGDFNNFEGSNLFIGDELLIADENDTSLIKSTYTITSITTNSSPVTTIFGVTPAPHDTNIKDFVKLNIPSNVFVIDGDYTDFFNQGTRLKAFTGNKTGDYITLYSKFINGETQIRVRENLIHDRGALIVDSIGSPPSLILDGNITPTYISGTQFNVVKSIKNNGFYTASSDSTYDSISNTTIIPVLESLDVSDATGEIHKFVEGVLNYRSVGFGETPELCEMVPETVVSVSIKEHLHINNLGIWTSDDIIAHGLHNEGWGFDLPYTTIFSTNEPVVTINNVAPASPTEDDLWFDTFANTDTPTGPGTLKQYIPIGSPPTGSPPTLGWVELQGNKAYWIDDNNSMYYRLMYQYYDNTGSPPPGYVDPTIGSPPTAGIDTDWILEFVKTPGYNDHLTGNGTREQQGFETFFATETSTSIAGTIFTLTSLLIPEVLTGSPPTLQPDPLMLEVYVNNTIANVNILSTNSFDILSPRLRVGDYIEARVFDDTGTASSVWVGSYDANASIVETFDMLLGYKFHIDGTDSLTNTIHIPDTPYFTGSPPVVAGWTVYDIFTGSPVDNIIEIVGSVGSPNNNGTYTITSVAQEGSPINHVVLTVAETLLDTGVFGGSPLIESGKALYQQWYQYIIVNTTANTIVVVGDATNDVSAGTFKITHSNFTGNNGVYTVTGTTSYDGRNTTIATVETITNTGNSGGWVESI